MGSYVSSQLMPNEVIALNAKVHWAIYVKGAAVFLLGIYIMSQGEAGAVFGLFIIALALFMLIAAFIRSITTELALTSKRVIAKFGLIRRDSIDLGLNKVEGVSYSQSVLGRLFGYGSIVVRGTGGGLAPIQGIAEPEAFRNAVSTALSE